MSETNFSKLPRWSVKWAVAFWLTMLFVVCRSSVGFLGMQRRRREKDSYRGMQSDCASRTARARARVCVWSVLVRISGVRSLQSDELRGRVNWTLTCEPERSDM